MKKLVFLALSILSCGAAFALPVGNPAGASLFFDESTCEGSSFSWMDLFHLNLGFYGDYVFDRHLEFRVFNGAPPSSTTFLNTTKLFTNAGYLGLNIADRLELFTTLGVSHFKGIGQMDDNTLGPGAHFEVEFSSRFSWSVGARATLLEYYNTSLGIEGQYFRYDTFVHTVAAGGGSFRQQDNQEVFYDEWQVGLGLAQRVGPFVPYIAAKWTEARIDIPGTQNMMSGGRGIKIKNAKRWGYAVGVSILDMGPAVCTVEGRWGDEKALYVNGQISF